MAAILCVRGLRLPGGRVLHADYIPFLATRTLSKFVKDHTRIALALLALLIAALSIAVLDPLRKLCIKVHAGMCACMCACVWFGMCVQGLCCARVLMCSPDIESSFLTIAPLILCP